jgi:MoxR-like ATPase
MSLLIESLRQRFGRSPAPTAPPTSAREVRKPEPAEKTSALPWRVVFRDPEKYIVGATLDRAAYVALLLGQPLLLTGEPGAGKSDFAHKLDHVFNLGGAEELHVKTTTVGRDLLYSFDDIGRFRDATGKTGSAVRPLCKYVRFNGLGRAILLSAGPRYPVDPVGREMSEILGRELEPGKQLTLFDLFPAEFGSAEGFDEGDPATGRSRKVVLIDEIDKAQRDTPNDLLDEIERMRFEIPELGIKVESSASHWPIVVITSNAERTLPAPFLRRCVFHRLTTPTDPNLLKTIIAVRMSESFSSSPAVEDALRIFLELRKNPGQRPPGLSELLSWCLLLQRMKFDGAPLPRDGANVDLLEASLAALSKTEVDFEAAKLVFQNWKDGGFDHPLGQST